MLKLKLQYFGHLMQRADSKEKTLMLGKIKGRRGKEQQKMYYNFHTIEFCCFCSVTKTLWPHKLQNARLPCPSLSHRVCSNSCQLSQWCHPTFHPLLPSSPLALNLSQHQGLFPMSWVFTSLGQSVGASTSASVLPMNTQGWFPLGLTGLISLLSKGFSRVFSAPLKASVLRRSAFFIV